MVFMEGMGMGRAPLGNIGWMRAAFVYTVQTGGFFISRSRGERVEES
jgi:hypothetical protein